MAEGLTPASKGVSRVRKTAAFEGHSLCVVLDVVSVSVSAVLIRDEANGQLARVTPAKRRRPGVSRDYEGVCLFMPVPL